MSFFFSRRARPVRLSVHKVGTSWSGRLTERLSRTDVALRLAICFVVLAGLVVALQSWQPPFPHRLGDDVPNGMMARIDFTRINQDKTELARIDRINREPPVFRKVPAGAERLENLATDLRRHLLEVVEVNRFNELSAECRAAFGWIAGGPTPTDPQTAEFEEEWKSLRSTFGPSNLAERPINELYGEFSQFVAPLIQVGVVDLAELSRPRQKIRLDDEISIVNDARARSKPSRSSYAELRRLSNIAWPYSSLRN